MVLMAVRNDKALDFVQIVLEIRDIRNNAVNAEHVIFRKGHAAVHDDDAVLVFERGDIHADQLKAAERNDLQF